VIHFLDASVLVKRYVDEPGSRALRAFLRKRRQIAASRLSAVEVPSALWRRARDGSLRVEDVHRSLSALATDLSELDVVEARPAVIQLAASLVARHPLRAYDAVQLASALRLGRDTGLSLSFSSADERLTEVARLEGLRVTQLA
jgi:predicted nucleic acid-binding protein